MKTIQKLPAIVGKRLNVFLTPFKFGFENCIVMGRCGSFWVRCGSLWIVVDGCGSFWVVLGGSSFL